MKKIAVSIIVAVSVSIVFICSLIFLFNGGADKKESLSPDSFSTSSWQTYINNQYNFSLQLPKDSKIDFLDLKNNEYVNENNPDIVFAAIFPTQESSLILKVIKKSPSYKDLGDYFRQFITNAEDDSKNALDPAITYATTTATIDSISGFKVSGCDSYCAVMTSYIFLEHRGYIYKISYQDSPDDMFQRITEANISEERKVEQLAAFEKDKIGYNQLQQVLAIFHFF
jgi:hypothetical protein